MEISPQDKLPPAWTRPQLIILDVDPPDEAGWQMAETLRRKSWGQGIPLILLLATAPTPSRLTHFQPARWVEKPLAIDALLSLVRESINTWEGGDSEAGK